MLLLTSDDVSQHFYVITKPRPSLVPRGQHISIYIYTHFPRMRLGNTTRPRLAWNADNTCCLVIWTAWLRDGRLYWIHRWIEFRRHWWRHGDALDARDPYHDTSPKVKKKIVFPFSVTMRQILVNYELDIAWQIPEVWELMWVQCNHRKTVVGSANRNNYGRVEQQAVKNTCRGSQQYRDATHNTHDPEFVKGY